ncbi:NRDE family protein [uncultured Polaribacter sp.]|uniref:NRDE family protein n=1 Tax=uncultured Polaribacter sp. TaxID=174711 RepID=UPI00259BD28D|nr:NRDE family protein [uncultured Polaribacter sp.]
MCTVTYLPLGKNDFILTSNRDETPLRKTIEPKKYIENGVELTYPKDEIAGGTWIGFSEKKRLVCLLNGGFVNHQRKLPYKMSRGIIVKNILSSDDGILFINSFDFDGIEPFTLIMVDWSCGLETFELIWDGSQKYFSKLKQEPKIWSSSTLYTDDMKNDRKIWFSNWLQNHKKYQQKDILEFHQNESLGSTEMSPKMKRSFVETVSVTSIQKTDKISLEYIDFLKEL